MATAVLKDHRRLTVGGVVFEKGVPRNVPADLVHMIEGDRRFEFVSGGTVDRQSKTTTRVISVADQIREAVKNLDLSDKANLTDNGRPLASVVSAKLGSKVTQMQVDKALQKKTKPEEPAVDNVKIKVKETAVSETDDPTTSGALEA